MSDINNTSYQQRFREEDELFEQMIRFAQSQAGQGVGSGRLCKKTDGLKLSVISPEGTSTFKFYFDSFDEKGLPIYVVNSFYSNIDDGETIFNAIFKIKKIDSNWGLYNSIDGEESFALNLGQSIYGSRIVLGEGGNPILINISCGKNFNSYCVRIYSYSSEETQEIYVEPIEAKVNDEVVAYLAFPPESDFVPLFQWNNEEEQWYFIVDGEEGLPIGGTREVLPSHFEFSDGPDKGIILDISIGQCQIN
jgi:hypothetical protein